MGTNGNVAGVPDGKLWSRAICGREPRGHPPPGGHVTRHGVGRGSAS